MLEHYFVKPQTVDRIRASWLGESIERYVTWLVEQGYAVRNIHRRVPLLVQFGEFAQGRGANRLEDLPIHVSAFVEDWLGRRPHQRRSEGRRELANEVRGPVEQLLRLVIPGCTVGTRRGPWEPPFTEQAPGFFPYLREERGLREGSLRAYSFHLRRLKKYLKRVGVDELGGLSPVLLCAFIADCRGVDESGKSGKCLGQSSMIGLCCSLRVFLRYLHREGILPRDLSPAVETPRHYRLADIPRSISWEEVRRVLEVVDRRTAVGRRDYAMLLLMITYGLRGHEVASLTLDDFDWKRERLCVPERKAGHSTAYPLSATVGEAIVDYLQHGRPQTTDRHLFLRVTAPHLPLRGYSVGNRATHYLHKADIRVARPGSHTFRHSCVQRLVDAEFSFKTIGDYVGHRSPSSTEVYTKVAIEALREVALSEGESIL